jgi:hypothetical protein
MEYTLYGIYIIWNIHYMEYTLYGIYIIWKVIAFYMQFFM